MWLSKPDWRTEHMMERGLTKSGARARAGGGRGGVGNLVVAGQGFAGIAVQHRRQRPAGRPGKLLQGEAAQLVQQQHCSLRPLRRTRHLLTCQATTPAASSAAGAPNNVRRAKPLTRVVDAGIGISIRDQHQHQRQASLPATSSIAKPCSNKVR